MSRLLNVRLTTHDAELVSQLRARGVSLSGLVRQAIRVEAERGRATPPQVDSLLADMLARYPTPAVMNGPRRPRTTDSRAVRVYIQRRLRAR
jgi:hypothetical protein